MRQVGLAGTGIGQRPPNPKLMDTIETGLEQLHGLFKDMMATFRKETEELRTAQEHFERVCAYACVHCTFLPGN